MTFIQPGLPWYGRWARMNRKECYRLTHTPSKIFGYATVWPLPLRLPLIHRCVCVIESKLSFELAWHCVINCCYCFVFFLLCLPCLLANKSDLSRYNIIPLVPFLDRTRAYPWSHLILSPNVLVRVCVRQHSLNSSMLTSAGAHGIMGSKSSENKGRPV